MKLITRHQRHTTSSSTALESSESSECQHTISNDRNIGSYGCTCHGICRVLLMSLSFAILVCMVQFPNLTPYSSSSNSVSFVIPLRQQQEEVDGLLNQEKFFNNFTLERFYQNPLILHKNCSVTVLFVDPNLGMDAMWALESVAANILPLETTCVLLQTSICDVLRNTRKENITITHSNDHSIVPEQNTNQDLGYRQKALKVQESALPLFRSLIEQGQVRMNVLNHTHYGLKSCNNFYNPSHLLENYDFWGPDEFHPQDSDLILMMQGDAVLCHELHVDKWRDVAWVGAPWPGNMGKRPWHFCSSLPTSWKTYHITEEQQEGSQEEPPSYPTPEQLCTNTTFGPHGNGGLALRSRYWLRRAIEYCPVDDRKVSGLSQEMYDAAPCRATEVVAEDVYFVTILRGIGAPLPTNYEAALFSTELRTPNMIAEQYNVSDELAKQLLQKRWYSRQDPTGMNYYRNMTRTTTKTIPNEPNNSTSYYFDPLVAIGIHKPWNEYLKHRINEKYLNDHCPYMMSMVQTSKHGRNYLLPKEGKDGN